MVLFVRTTFGRRQISFPKTVILLPYVNVFTGENSLTEALALVGSAVHVNLCRDDVTEWHEHLGELGVTELLG